ncbi:MAG: DUF1835 domain-containing protein [Chitinophagaceae bacterium]|nr:DUF1835 domain-containing protein [Chitinophagaceae bacterium]
MIHIVFQPADENVLQKVLALDDSLQGDIVCIKDDFAVGPIADIFSVQGIELRKQWWREVLAGGDHAGTVDDGSVDDGKTVDEVIDKLRSNTEESVWIWAAQNKHDVSGYYWLVSQLQEYKGRIFILYLNNLPFINEKGNIFYPEHLFEIPPKEFLKAKKLARPVTASEFEIDTDEWAKMGNENKGVRTLEGGKKLIQHDYDYYDSELLKFITTDWQKVNKLFNTFYSKSIITTGDAYMLWRLKLMIKERRLDAQGDIKGLKDFEVKIKSIESKD